MTAHPLGPGDVERPEILASSQSESVGDDEGKGRGRGRRRRCVWLNTYDMPPGASTLPRLLSCHPVYLFSRPILTLTTPLTFHLLLLSLPYSERITAFVQHNLSVRISTGSSDKMRTPTPAHSPRWHPYTNPLPTATSRTRQASPPSSHLDAAFPRLSLEPAFEIEEAFARPVVVGSASGTEAPQSSSSSTLVDMCGEPQEEEESHINPGGVGDVARAEDRSSTLLSSAAAPAMDPVGISELGVGCC